MTITRDFKLHLNDGSSSPLMIRANQYDSGEIWRFTLFGEDGVKYNPSSAIILGTTMSGTLVTRDATIEDDKVIVEESRSMTQSPGLNLFELVIDGGSHGTANFIVAVEPRPNKVFLSENDLQTMEKAIEAGASVGGIRTQVESNTNAIESERTARQNGDSALHSEIESVRSAVGSPLVASTVAEMTNTNKVYVYTGSETGYTAGNWYYYNGSAWVDGGVYNSVAFNTDKTLSVEGSAADAKKTGDVVRVFNTLLDERNLFLHAPSVSGKYYYGTAVDDSAFLYFIVPVTSGKTYKFGCNVRFLSSQTTGIDNTAHDTGYQYTADFTGDLYVTVRLAQSDSFSMCLSEYDISDVGTTEQPRLSQNLLAQESGDSESLAMSQSGVGHAISEVAVLRDGKGQVKPQNIQGVTVTGGNILDDAERLYCSQRGHVGGDGYVIITNGKALIQNDDELGSFLINVKQNTHYTANNSIRFAVLLKNLHAEGTSPVYYSTVVGSALSNITSFDTGEADYIIVSWNFSKYPINTFVISEGNTPTADVKITLPDWWTGGAEIVKPKYISKTGSLSDGTFLALMGYKQNLRKGERYVFSGDLTTMSELHFGFTYADSFSASSRIYNEFIIDSTYITYKTDGLSTSYTERFEHGLTFANNLQFIFEYLPEGNAKITLLSNGIAFTHTLPFVKQTISQVVVRSVGSTLTNCKLSWTPIDIDKSIWMFGDSYFAYSAERWTYYLQQYGYAQNALIDGWPGEGSVNAKNSLLTLIQFGKPKYIVWCMGMNDGSDTDASTPSADWVADRDSMLSICEVNGITPIFATIPNVPSVLNTGKNAWIKASGYRYIDFAASVGAESAGSTWYSGMLSHDNVHPSESGAKALFARALVDFPEIMLNE